MNKEKTNIGLFFGSFNPLHNGHIAIAEYFTNNNFVDEIWFVVSPQSPFKQHFTYNKDYNTQYFIPEETRLEILNKATRKYPYFKICDIEFSMPKPSYSIDTLKELSKRFPDKKFTLIMGSDQLPDFKLWKDSQEILNNYQIYVYPRSKSDLQYLLPGMKIFENVPLLDISSTQIREKIAKGENIDKLIP
ncbi:nicotinate-nucleotide adenylyltransferase [Odoribacter sp. OttesenSCG-928-L07]|nr:nicotinate-nucleotide adenylyltransferase [Odoribacter sp. OttesenSCG-928-L07]MDL2239473.1 nicotinate-nucleotide adenylyltransferase [Bacteroidales bacterium OttesenSCG-928-L14]MDL2240692.1 nicotinate-nucleotide adenylyltransferase [Bacteroidales bacterium OttesenSCG-928-K22]